MGDSLRYHNDPGIQKINAEIEELGRKLSQFPHDWVFDEKLGEEVCSTCGRWKRGTLFEGCLPKYRASLKGPKR